MGNYIGFKDYTSMYDYNKMDLYEPYFTVFPNKRAYIFSYFGLVAIVGLIIFSLCRFRHKDKPDEGFNNYSLYCSIIINMIIYFAFFIGYFIYSLYEYFNIYKNRNPEDLIKIRVDYFIENLLKEIYNRHIYKEYILSIVILLSYSLLINILSWIYSIIIIKRNIELLKNEKN